MGIFNHKSPITLALIVITAAFGFGIRPAQATVITNGCADSSTCTLAELANGGTIIIEDKLFDDWWVDDFSSNSPLNLGNIDVLALDDQPLNPGLRFNANGEFSVVGFDAVDITIGYRVSTLDGSDRIKDNSLELTGFTFGAGSIGGFVEMYEDVFDAAGNLIGEKFVTADGFNLPPVFFNLFDSATFPAVSQVLTETTIFLSGDQPQDTVSLDNFEQRFSQLQVPEPGILLLLTMGLAGLGLYRKR